MSPFYRRVLIDIAPGLGNAAGAVAAEAIVHRTTIDKGAVRTAPKREHELFLFGRARTAERRTKLLQHAGFCEIAPKIVR